MTEPRINDRFGLDGGGKAVATGALLVLAIVVIVYLIIALGLSQLGEPWGFVLSLLLVGGLAVSVLSIVARRWTHLSH